MAGILRDEDHTLYLPFTFNAGALAAEYPTVDPGPSGRRTVDKLLKAHSQFDAAVRELAKM